MTNFLGRAQLSGSAADSTGVRPCYRARIVAHMWPRFARGVVVRPGHAGGAGHHFNLGLPRSAPGQARHTGSSACPSRADASAACTYRLSAYIYGDYH